MIKYRKTVSTISRAGQTPASRQSILKKQKFPNRYQGGYYNDALNTTKKFMIDGCKNEEILVAKIEELIPLQEEAVGIENSSLATKLKYNIEGLQNFHQNYSQYGINFNEVSAIDDKNKLEFNGVEISVYPDLLIRNQNTGKIGFIKLYFSSSIVVDFDMSKIIGTLLCLHAQQFYDDEFEPNSCYLLDIINNNKPFIAPEKRVKITNDVKSVCNEIRGSWSILENN